MTLKRPVSHTWSYVHNFVNTSDTSVYWKHKIVLVLLLPKANLTDINWIIWMTWSVYLKESNDSTDSLVVLEALNPFKWLKLPDVIFLALEDLQNHDLLTVTGLWIKHRNCQGLFKIVFFEDFPVRPWFKAQELFERQRKLTWNYTMPRCSWGRRQIFSRHQSNLRYLSRYCAH